MYVGHDAARHDVEHVIHVVKMMSCNTLISIAYIDIKLLLLDFFEQA